MASSRPMHAATAGVICSHREMARRAALMVRSAASACKNGKEGSYARLPQVANYNSEVSWVVPTTVIRPKTL